MSRIRMATSRIHLVWVVQSLMGESQNNAIDLHKAAHMHPQTGRNSQEGNTGHFDFLVEPEQARSMGKFIRHKVYRSGFQGASRIENKGRISHEGPNDSPGHAISPQKRQTLNHTA